MDELIRDFCNKWIEKFSDPRSTEYDLADAPLANDCENLNFKMDCGKAFEKEYGKAFYELYELKKVLYKIFDISLLGSAVYSKWRYFNHWAYDGSDICKEEEREWFILILKRMLFINEDAKEVERIELRYFPAFEKLLDEGSRIYSSIILDKTKKSLTLEEKVGNSCESRQEYKNENTANNLLTIFTQRKALRYFIDENYEYIRRVGDYKYSLKIFYSVGEIFEKEDFFFAETLPADFKDFVRDIQRVKSVMDGSALISPYEFKKHAPQKDAYMYCSVEFDSYGEQYYYISDFPYIEICDIVRVPVGKENKIITARVKDIEYFKEDEVPIPIKSTKHIIERVDDDEV